MNMPMNFGQAVEEKSFDNSIIPKDALLWCHLKLRGFKNSKETNGRYMDIELTVCENQPHAKRKIWDKIADPFDANNSEEWRNMAYGAIRRILEAVKGANPQDQNSYALNSLEDLNGLVVPIHVGVEKGNANYPDDKNKADYLSPYSSVKKVVQCFELLKAGTFTCAKEKPAAAPAQGNMFAGTASTPPATMTPPPAANTAAPAQDPNWLAQQQGQQPADPAQQQVPNPGFQQGQPPAQTQQVPSQPPSSQPMQQETQQTASPPLAATPPASTVANPPAGTMDQGQSATTAASPSNQGAPAQFQPQGQPAG